MKQAIIYVRVSTDEQADKGYSLPSQEARCRDYAQRMGFNVLSVFSDDFTGAIPLEQRPEGKRAYATLRDQADALIAYSMDRLVRPPDDGDEWDTPVLIRSLARLSKEIHTVQRGRIGTGFADLLIAMLDAKSAGDERRKIIERTSRGRSEKAKSGKVVGTGIPPYGYLYMEGHLVVNETEAEIVRMIFSLYTEDRLTMRAIAFKLSETHVPTPWAKIGRSSENGVWHHTAVARILGGEVYVGRLRYGRHIGSGGKGGKRPIEDTIAVSVPAIVPEDAWKIAQERMAQNLALARRNRKRDYLLSGMVKCGCGRAMHAQPGSRKGHYWYHYRCSEKAARIVDLEGQLCFEKGFSGNELEQKVWEYVYGLLTGDFESELHEAQAASRREQEPLFRELEIINGLLVEVEQEANKLVNVAKGASGMFLDKINQEAQVVNKRHTDLLARKQKTEEKIDEGTLTDEQIESLLEFRNRVLVGLSNPTCEDKRKYYEILQVRVVVKDHKVQVSCVIASATSESSCRT